MPPAGRPLDGATMDHIASRFRLLGDPMRLRLLNTLSGGELSVGDLVTATGATQANVSKHLAVLTRGGIVQRRKEGLRVYYSITDPSVFELCDIVCGSLREYLNRELSHLPAAHRPSPPRRATRGRPATATRRRRASRRDG